MLFLIGTLITEQKNKTQLYKAHVQKRLALNVWGKKIKTGPNPLCRKLTIENNITLHQSNENRTHDEHVFHKVKEIDMAISSILQ